MSSSWTRAIDAIIRGESKNFRGVLLGRTPTILREFGLGPHDLEMSAAKIAKARKEHPEISLQIWYDLPALLQNPHAIFPSTRHDGTVIVVITVLDADGNPIIVPIVPSADRPRNVVLSVYGKIGNERLNGHQWIDNQITTAKREGKMVFEASGSADSEPKPESADAISWSPDPISVDRSTEPRRQILKLREKSTKSWVVNLSSDKNSPPHP
jgi:Phage MuF-C-terminal domain